MTDDTEMPCFNCGRPVRQGIKFCDIVCASQYAQEEADT